MNRTTDSALGQIVRNHAPREHKFRCRIKAVNYINKRMMVTAQNYSGPRKVAVSAGVDLGTTDRPRVFPGDFAIVEKQADGKWLATSVVHKIKCATGSAGAEVEVDTSSSYTVDGFGTTITPMDLFLPPVQPLGDLWTPNETPPGAGGTYDVGGGYAGSFTAPLAQNIGLPNGGIWGKYFVTMTGSAGWTMTLNGTAIASGTGSDSGTLSETFAASSTFVFSIDSGSGSDLWYGVGT